MKKQLLFVHGGGEGAYEEDGKLAAALQALLGRELDGRGHQFNNDLSELAADIINRT